MVRLVIWDAIAPNMTSLQCTPHPPPLHKRVFTSVMICLISKDYRSENIIKWSFKKSLTKHLSEFHNARHLYEATQNRTNCMIFNDSDYDNILRNAKMSK